MSRRPRSVEIDPDEALPEADRLEGFPHPRETTRLLGQAAAERTLAEALASGRMHHGWILSGLEGIGKATLAYRFARAALAEGDEAKLVDLRSLEVPVNSRVARQVRALSHPGLLVIRRPYLVRDKRIASFITVDEVRRIASFLQLSAGGSGSRVVIIDRAEEMNANAANALLKSLEEPPPRTVFLLVTSEPGRLLPTIHSRCRRLDIRPLDAASLTEALTGLLTAAAQQLPNKDDLQLVTDLSGGSVRRALTLLSGDAIGIYRAIVALLTSFRGMDLQAVHRLADQVSGSGGEGAIATLFTLLQDMIARCLRQALTGEAPLAGERVLVERLRSQGPDPAELASWALLWETIGREKADALALNLDRKALTLETFLRIEAVSRGAV
jgi:DNA polymerase III subunit delta'